LLAFVLQSHITAFKGYGSHSPLVKWYRKLPEVVKDKVRDSGFGYFMEILPSFKGNMSIIHGLAERWRDTTNSFHLPFGEMTMTPKDFAMITGLNFGGRPLLYHSKISNKRIEELLGPAFMQVHNKKANIRCTALREAYADNQDWSNETTTYVTRAFFLCLVGSSIFSTADQTVAAGLLETFADLDEVGSFNWGGSALAALYNNMGQLSRGSGTCVRGFFCAWEVNTASSLLFLASLYASL
jgi:hypothetical protein